MNDAFSELKMVQKLSGLTDDRLQNAHSLLLFPSDVQCLKSIGLRLTNYSVQNFKTQIFNGDAVLNTEKELDSIYKLQQIFKGKVIFFLNNITDFEEFIQSSDLNGQNLNMHIFHASQSVAMNALSQIVASRNRTLQNVAISGTQRHLSLGTKYERQLFDSFRLGNIYKDPEALIEPLNMADIALLDLSVVKQSDIPGREFISVSGLSSETMNQIASTCGSSPACRYLAITGFDLLNEPGEADIDTVCQIIYYFIQGMEKTENVLWNEADTQKYVVNDVDGYDQIEFAKNALTNEWMVYFPLELPSQYKKFSTIPCTYFDYDYSVKGELPPRLYEIFMVLNQFHEAKPLI
jgi:hypothetical protein